MSKEVRKADVSVQNNDMGCNQKQYEMLLRCSKKKDVAEWNQWREDNPDAEVWLQRADLNSAYLDGVYLLNAHLEGADLNAIHLEGATLQGNLEGANLCDAHLVGANLVSAGLRGANLCNARLEGAFLLDAHLEGAGVYEAHLEGTDLSNAYIQGAGFEAVDVNGKTSFLNCKIDQSTDFSNVALGQLKIDQGTRQLLEYNIRRKNWHRWFNCEWERDRGRERVFGKKWFNRIRWLPLVAFNWVFVWPFWFISDYGRSTRRIIWSFVFLSLLFAVIYTYWGYWFPPGVIENMEVAKHEPLWHYGLLTFFRPIYFSVVTMTTLGFGDMYAKADSIAGHLFLTAQVILGYVMLGALVTRFAVLFNTGGPAGNFVPMSKETKERLNELETMD